MESNVREGHAPAVVIALQPGETITSEAGAMMFVSGDVETDVQMPGGLMGGLKRKALAGESLVTLQTLPFSRTAKQVRQAAGGGQGERGGVLGSIIG